MKVHWHVVSSFPLYMNIYIYSCLSTDYVRIYREGYTLTSCLNTLTSRISLPSCIAIDFYSGERKRRGRRGIAGRIEWKKFNIRRKRMGEVSLLSSLHRPVSNVLNSRDRISPRVIIISLRIIVERWESWKCKKKCISLDSIRVRIIYESEIHV